MEKPRAMVEEIEKQMALPAGSGDRFSGYAILGLPFQSGHILALRRFSASSLGPGYTSVWHRDPDGRWTFHQDVQPEQSCPRYFGKAISKNAVEPITLEWSSPDEFTVTLDGQQRLDWQVTLASTPATNCMNAVGSLPHRTETLSPRIRDGSGPSPRAVRSSRASTLALPVPCPSKPTWEISGFHSTEFLPSPTQYSKLAPTRSCKLPNSS